MIMGAWIATATHPPPHMQTITVRYGSVVISAAFSKWRNAWRAILPQGREEDLAPPAYWWSPEATVDEYRVEAVTEAPRMRRSKGPVQLALAFSQSAQHDSGLLSGRATEAERKGAT